ncbi:hypothetical protein [uncultured Flavobacterium sp.]|uniref:hypothetical protein n=1 Tax=uncultured Flavobacterium sp. TaxID=165435 RepID=UPI0030ECC14A|tara:strand:- start:71576 stop:71962 length:387 start_codon:yes stop_codon:yes gene_type:complete
MKTFLTFIFTLTFGLIYGQEKNKTEKDSIVWTKVTCEKGIEDAKIDAEKGTYKCLSYGLMFETNPELNKFINDYRKKKYGIITRNGGCVITDYSECYLKTMKELVLKKFGEDIFEKSRKEAEDLYSKK